MKTASLLSISLASLLLAGCSGGGGGGGSASSVSPGATTPPPKAMDVTLVAAQTALAVGDTLEVRLEATQLSGLYGAGVDLAYDPAVLDFLEAKSGGFIPGATIASGLKAGKPGVVTLGASAEGTAAGGTGSGSIFVVRFTAKAAGASSVTPSELVLETAMGGQGIAPGLKAASVTVQ